MTEQQINEAVAEVCGWEKIDSYISIQDGSEVFWYRLNDDVCTDCTAANLPNYVNDLNAMHEAEKVMTSDQWDGYASTLCSHWLKSRPTPGSYYCHATAKQRAEAFLRTFNKWTT